MFISEKTFYRPHVLHEPLQAASLHKCVELRWRGEAKTNLATQTKSYPSWDTIYTGRHDSNASSITPWWFYTRFMGWNHFFKA